MSLIYQSPDHRVHGRRPGIYLGGKSDAKNKQKLLDRHITHILNVTPPKEVSIQAGVPNYFEKPGSICHRTNDAPSFSSAAAETCFTYRRIAVYDSSTSVPALLDAAEEICSFIATALCHGSVLVHCQRGVSRSVAALAFYLIRYVFFMFRGIHCIG